MNKPSKSKAEQHELTMAINIGHWHYAFRNHSALFECAHCKKQQRRNTNFLGNRFELQCDGVKFHRVPRNRLREEVNRTDIITRMEAAQQRFGSFPSLLVSAENDRRLQLEDRKPCYHIASLGFCPFSNRPESEREILRCAPPFDAQAEHEADLRYESRVDAESWQYDGPAEREDA